MSVSASADGGGQPAGWWRDRQTLIRVVGLCALGFFCMLSYAIARPTCESLFLDAHSSDDLPKVWILVALGAFVTVAVYNRFSQRVDLVTLYGAVCVITCLFLALLIGAWHLQLPYIGYALYVWKDIYIVVLVEIFYSFANAVFPIRNARWFYGLFGIFGSLGGIAGGLGGGELAVLIGTEHAIWSVVPALLAGFLICSVLARHAGHRPRRESAEAPSMGDGLRVLRRSTYLAWMLMVIGVIQVVITLIDFQFNGIVEAAYPDKDLRTEIVGRVYAAVNTGTIVMHASVGPILRTLTVSRTLLAVPLLLGLAVASFAIHPGFAAVSVAKVASKVFDYTVFRAAKEMLYIPLSYAEKTSGKALVDMLGYRVAKGGAAGILLLLALPALSPLISWINLDLILVWLALTGVIVILFRRRVSRDEEIHGQR